MKKLLKSGICGSINSILMHRLLRKSQHLRLLFNEQYMNSNHVTLEHVKKKKRTKEQKRSLWNAEVGSVDPNIHYILKPRFKFQIEDPCFVMISLSLSLLTIKSFLAVAAVCVPKPFLICFANILYIFHFGKSNFLILCFSKNIYIYIFFFWCYTKSYSL